MSVRDKSISTSKWKIMVPKCWSCSCCLFDHACLLNVKQSFTILIEKCLYLAYIHTSNIRATKFEKVRIHFLSDDFLFFCYPEILLPWQCDATTSRYWQLLRYKSVPSIDWCLFCCRWYWSCVLWDWTSHWQEVMGSSRDLCSIRCSWTGAVYSQ